MRAFVVLAITVASASAAVDPFEVVPQLEPFKGFLPEWLNSSLYQVSTGDLEILKELIVNGTTVTSVAELLDSLKANGHGNLFKVLSSTYSASNADLENLSRERKQLLMLIGADFGQIASEAIEDVDVEAVRNLAAKVMEAYEGLQRVDDYATTEFGKALPKTSEFLKDPQFRKVVKQTANVAVEAAQA